MEFPEGKFLYERVSAIQEEATAIGQRNRIDAIPKDESGSFNDGAVV